MRVGILSIGQTPRPEIAEEMLPYLGKNVEIHERGALDNISENEIESLTAKEKDVFITKLRNGNSVTVAKNAIISLLQEKIYELDKVNVQTIILACTGSFPAFNSSSPVILPDQVLLNVVKSVHSGRLGIIYPLARQESHIRNKWSKIERDIYFSPASPYHGKMQIKRATKELRKKKVDMIIMDCMGYSNEHKVMVSENLNIPVILSRSIVARVAGELINNHYLK